MILCNHDGKSYRYFGEVTKKSINGYGILYDLLNNELTVGQFRDEKPTGVVQVYTINSYKEVAVAD